MSSRPTFGAIAQPEIESRIVQIAQVSGLAAATPTSLFSPAVGVTAIITAIVMCNTDDSTAQRGKVYHDENGTTYTVATRIRNRLVAAGSDEILVDLEFGMEDPSGNIAVEDVTGSKLTFTLYGRLRKSP